MHDLPPWPWRWTAVAVCRGRNEIWGRVGLRPEILAGLLDLHVTSDIYIDADTDELILAYFGGEDDPNDINLSLGAFTIQGVGEPELVSQLLSCFHHELVHWALFHEGLNEEDHDVEHRAVDWALDQIDLAYA